MGAFLDKPITEKSTHAGRGNGLVFGLSSMQGWRTEMEDAHTAEVSIPGFPEGSFFAVFDGHGGKTVSLEAAVRLIPNILESKAFRSGSKSLEALTEALFTGFLSMDHELRTTNPQLRDGADHSGSTAIAILVTPTHYLFANSGDSRALLSRGETCVFATQDHKPTNPGEMSRVKNAGGFVEMGRVCGNLAVSRALGDFQYKDSPNLPAEQQKITCAPDISPIERTPQDEFLVLACDGIWDVMTNQQVVNFVASHLKAGTAPEVICERLLDHCLEKNSKDNMSAIIVILPAAPKPMPDFQLPSFHDPVEENARRQNDQREAMALHQRLSMMLTGDPNMLQRPSQGDDDDDDEMAAEAGPNDLPEVAEG